MSGRELERKAIEMGLTDAELCRLADVSTHTLSKVFKDQKVKEVSKSKVIRAIERFAAHDTQSDDKAAAG